MAGFLETLEITDNNIKDVSELNMVGYRKLDECLHGVWEGEMNLSGHHLLWDYDTTSDSYGSGKIFELNWSPLGFTGTKFHVTGLVLTPFETLIYVNNKDPLYDNYFTRTVGRTELTDAFITPFDETNLVYLETYKDEYPTGYDSTGLYCYLYDQSDNLLTGLVPLVCKKYAASTFTNTAYNLRKYYVVIPPGNGYATTKIKTVTLKDSGGTTVLTQTLKRTASSITVDEEVAKFKHTTLIVDFGCKNS
jgi:hypothetical protein